MSQNDHNKSGRKAPRPPVKKEEVDIDMELELEDDAASPQIQKPRLPDRIELDKVRQEVVEKATYNRALPKEPNPGKGLGGDFETNVPGAKGVVQGPDPRAVQKARAKAGEELFDSVADLPAPVKSESAPVEKAAPAAPETMEDDLDDYLKEIDQPKERAVVPKREMTNVEKGSLGLAAALVLSAVIWFAVTLFGSRPQSSEEKPSLSASLPMKGDLFTVGEASTGWRDSKESDKLSMMKVTHPERGERRPAIVPQVRLSMDALPGAGYLRVIFRDSSGKQSGDTRIVKVVGGAFEKGEAGEEILSAKETVVYCSRGYLSEQDLITYQSASDEPRWSVEIAESTNYAAADKEWKRLGYFMIDNQY